MSELFRIKICGITNPSDATVAAQAGADAIGLNFYAASRRSVTAEQAAEIETPDSVSRVGVFVNHSCEEIGRIAKVASLDFVQLHGDESPEGVAELAGMKLIPVIRIRPDATAEHVLAGIRAWTADENLTIAAILLDAQVGKAYGGTGHTLDWDLAAEVVPAIGVSLILAGGLNADNVAQAIEQVSPHAVDVASGVESEPGIKDPKLVTQFVVNAQR